MIIEAHNVTFSDRDIRLVGTLHKPNGDGPHPAMVVLHGSHAGLRTDGIYQPLGARLPERGIAVLVYDRRGSGESSGDFTTTDFSDLAQDAIAAIDFLRTCEDIDHKRIGVYGISQGGWIAPIVAARKSEVAFLIIVSGPGVSPAEQMDYAARYSLQEAGYPETIVAHAIALRHRIYEYFRGRLARDAVQVEIDQVRGEQWFQQSYIIADLPKNVRESKWYYEMDYDPLPIWQRVKQPTLFLFAEHDRWVPIAESMSKLQEATAHIQDVTMMRLEGTDHMMRQNGQVSDRYVERMCEWLLERLG